MARKNLFAPPTGPASGSEAPSPAPRPAAGTGPLALMRQDLKNMVRDIRTDLIDDSAYADRIPGADTELDELIDSIRERGQLVPALVRPSAEDPKRFEIVYGRRRLAAARELDQPLKAVVHDLDDIEALIAQGAENNRRLDPSFIDKAVFAHRLSAQGEHTSEVIAEILAVHRSILSRMGKIVAALGEPLILSIGSCHGIGRRPWEELADEVTLLAAKNLPLGEVDFSQDTDEDRFTAFRSHVKRRLARAHVDEAPTDAPKEAPDGPAVKRVKLKFGRRRKGAVYLDRNSRGVNLRFIRGEDTDGFDEWLSENVDDVLGNIRDLWLRAQPRPEEKE